MSVVVTGGAGYIGSTVASALADRGITPVILDDLSRGRLEFTAGRAFYHADIADPAAWTAIFAGHRVDAVIHCAGRIDVNESLGDPLGYFATNVAKTTVMLEQLTARGCDRVVFSSSASVYGDATEVEETAPLASASPYARSKAMVEQVLADAAAAGQVRSISLRYFNPIGADPTLRTGQYDPDPTHVLGRLLAAAATGEPFRLFGVDWPTRDGSAIRDFIHVWDLALAHVAAVRRFDVVTGVLPATVVNIATGRGTTVRELIAAVQAIVPKPIAVESAPRREGDVVGSYASCRKAAELLGWRAELTVADAIRDALDWSAAFAPAGSAAFAPAGVAVT